MYQTQLFRTRERLFKFGNRLTQFNLNSDIVIVNETRYDQMIHKNSTILKCNNTRGANYGDIKQKLNNDLMTRLSEI